MQITFVDESGTGEEPIAVMTDIITDSYSMRPTKSDRKSLHIPHSKFHKP